MKFIKKYLGIEKMEKIEEGIEKMPITLSNQSSENVDELVEHKDHGELVFTTIHFSDIDDDLFDQIMNFSDKLSEDIMDECDYGWDEFTYVDMLERSFFTQIIRYTNSPKIIGLILVTDDEYCYKYNRLGYYISNIGISKKYQHHGLGTQLIENLSTFIQQQNSSSFFGKYVYDVKKIILDVETYNKKAIAFYEKLGFSITNDEGICQTRCPGQVTFSVNANKINFNK